MNAEEIRQKAIECGENFKTMCISNTTIDRKFNAVCAYNCEYTGMGHCSTVYGYEHGFADGEKEISDTIIRNVVASLEEIKDGYGTLDEFIKQLKGE